MSDQVKIGGDSKELITAIDAAETRFKRFEHAVSGSTAPEGFKKRIVDSTAASAEGFAKSGLAARKASVDYKLLADESKRAGAAIDAAAVRRRKNSAAGFAPPARGKYISPAAEEEGKRIDALVASTLLEQERAAAKIGGSRNARGGGKAGGGGGAGRVVGDIVNIGTASSGAVTRVNALSHVLGGIGPAAGVVAAVAILTKVHDVAKEAELAAKAFHRELNQRPSEVVGNLGAPAIVQQLARDKELEKDARKKARYEDYFYRAADNVPGFSAARRAAAGGDIEENRTRLRREGAKRRGELEGALVNRSDREGSIAREGAFGSERVAASKKAELETEEKIAAIQLDRNISNKAKAPLIENENDLLSVQKQKIEAAADAQERQFALSRKLTNLRVNGGSEVDAAREKVLAARKDIEGAGSEEQKKAATNAYGVALADLAVAQNKQQIMQASVRIADFRGNQEAETANSLKEQLAAAKQILDTDQRTLAVAQAKKAIVENEKQLELARIARTGSLNASAIGTTAEQRSVTASPEERQRIGLRAQVAIARELYQRATERRAAEKGSADSIAAQGEAYNRGLSAQASLRQFNRDTAFARKQELTAAKALTAEMLLQSRAENYLASLVRIRAATTARAAAHNREGRPDLAAQDNAQGALSIRAQQFSEFQDQEADPEAYRDRKRKAQAQARRFDGLRDSYQSSRAHGAYGQTGFGADLFGRDEAPGRRNDRDFRNQFRPLTNQAQQKNEAAQTPAPKPVGAELLVGKVDNLITTLNALPGKIGVV